MTAKEAIVFLCPIYRTDIKDPQIKPVEKWLESNVKEDEMQRFVGKILQTVKTEYEKFPSIATLEELIKPNKDNLEQIANMMFNKLLNKINIYRDFITDDSRIQSGLNAIGGWKGLCNSVIAEQKWIRKDFIKAFVQEAINPVTKCICNEGIGTSGKIIFIGDEKKCKQIEQAKYNKFNKMINNINKFEVRDILII
jgi:hypothetical protein